MKRLTMLLLAAIMCVSLAACGGGTSANGPTQTQAPGKTDGITESAQPTQSEPPKADPTPVIAVGELITADKCEFSIDYINITDDVMPPAAGSWYSHYQAEQGKVYVDLCVAYKNTASSKVDADKTVSGKLIYADKYEFTGASMIEKDSRSDFTYSNITSIAPLTTEYVHYLFEVPEEVEGSGLSIVLKMNIGGTNYKVIVREGDGAPAAEEPPQTGKTSGAVELGEVVVTKSAEFKADYADITGDVMPPSPGSWYSHYQASEGKVFVDVCFAYKNTTGKSVGADDVISAKLKYADKYDYSGFSMIEEDSRSDFTYSNITSIAPLTTEYIHYLFEVPEEVQSSSERIVITFSISGNTYTYTVR